MRNCTSRSPIHLNAAGELSPGVLSGSELCQKILSSATLDGTPSQADLRRGFPDELRCETDSGGGPFASRQNFGLVLMKNDAKIFIFCQNQALHVALN